MSLDVERLIGRLEGFLLAAQAPEEVMSALYALCPLATRKQTQRLPDQNTAEPEPPQARNPRRSLIPETEVAAVRELMTTMTDAEIGERYYCSAGNVFSFRQRHGLKRPKGNPNFRKAGGDKQAPAETAITSHDRQVELSAGGITVPEPGESAAPSP